MGDKRSLRPEKEKRPSEKLEKLPPTTKGPPMGTDVRHLPKERFPGKGIHRRHVYLIATAGCQGAARLLRRQLRPRHREEIPEEQSCLNVT